MMDGKITIKIKAVCRDKDGKIKWTDTVEIPVVKPEDKESKNGVENGD